MNLENLETKEPIINDFFTWLFDDDKIINKKVSLQKEIDLTLAPYYMDANIYFPKQISDFFNTKAMKRLGRINHLALAIDEFPNAYHSRLEHSKGVYYRKLEEMVYNFQNPSWRKYIENHNLKLYLLGDLIKMAGHDIGHMPLSHAMEKQIYSSHGAHEVFGQRIMLEDPEIQEILTSISLDLPKVLKELYEKHVINFQEHDESNYDVDRFDYISRDNLYLGNPLHIPYEEYESVFDGEKNIDVYAYSSLRNIEEFLEAREKNYLNVYSSQRTQIRECSIGIFFRAFLSSNSKCGNNLRNFIYKLKNINIYDVDLNEFWEWDDIKLYSEILDIAKNHEDKNIRDLATMLIPNMNSFLYMLYSHLQVKNGKNYDIGDKNFLIRIKKLICDNNELSQNLRNPDFTINNTLIYDSSQPLPIRYANQIKSGLIETSTIYFKAYKPKNPIYVRDKYNNIYELSQHPDRKCDWAKKSTVITTQYAYIPFLKFNGVTESEIEKMSNYFYKMKTDNSANNQRTTANMQPLQVGHNIEDVFLEL